MLKNYNSRGFNPHKDLLRILHEIDEASCDSIRVERLRSFFNFRHQAHFTFDGVLQRPDLKDLLGIRWKLLLPKLISLGRYAKKECSYEMDYRHYDYNDCPPIEINQNDFALQEKIGSVNQNKFHRDSHVNVHNIIEKAIKVGLLYRPPFGNHYSFNNVKKSDNYAKVYFFNNDILDYLEETASENKIKIKFPKFKKSKSSSKSTREVYFPSSTSPSPISSLSIDHKSELQGSLSISVTEKSKKDAEPQSHQKNRSSKIEQKTPIKPIKSLAEIIGKNDTEKLNFTQKVNNKFWTVTEDECVKMIEQNNPEIKNYMKISEEDGMQFKINQHRSKAGNLTKLSIRETNKFCLKLKEVREDELREAWGSFGYYDVNASIYRITYFVNSGKWLDSSVDLYQKMCPQKFNKDKHDRETFKKILMSVYFSPSAKQSVSWIKRRIYNGVNRGKLTKEEGEKLCKQAEQAITFLYKRVREVIGKTYSNQIFYYESCIYMHLRRYFQDRGYEVRQCYDAFYINGTIPDDMDSIMQRCANEFMKNRRNAGGEIPYDYPENRPVDVDKQTFDAEANAALMELIDNEAFRLMIDNKFTMEANEIYKLCEEGYQSSQ